MTRVELINFYYPQQPVHNGIIRVARCADGSVEIDMNAVHRTSINTTEQCVRNLRDALNEFLQEGLPK